MDAIKKMKLWVVVGPTASGKTKLSVELAKWGNGEIVNADSMQIYQQMNIATAKPSPEEQEGVVHHLMDFLPPDRAYSVSDYVQDAHRVITEISLRNKQPIVVGGTGLYYSSLLDNLQFSKIETDCALRERLAEEAKADHGQALYERLVSIDPEAAKEIHPHNYVRLVRALEVFETTGKTLTQLKEESRKIPSPYEATVIGLMYRDRQRLYDRIDRRVDQMLQAGLLAEAQQVLQRDDLKTAYNAIGYKELVPYFQGNASLEECVDRIKQESRRYAKRQLTWFRRDERIHWLYVDESACFDEVLQKTKKILENSLDL